LGLSCGVLTKADEVATKLRNAIESGTWEKGAKLPGELSLATNYGVGRVTIRRAIALLAEEGLLATQMGVGTVVMGGSGTT
jgi:DNA-binding GntR family transcriptional regulator